MTIIVGIAHDGKVYMAGDRGMSDKDFIGSMVTPKIHKVGPILMGYSASQGTGQLAHLITYPKPVYENLEAWLEDWSVAEYDMVANGSGYAYAMGSLFSTRDWDSPRNRVREAVKASIRYSPTCQGPVDTLVL